MTSSFCLGAVVHNPLQLTPIDIEEPAKEFYLEPLRDKHRPLRSLPKRLATEK